MRELPERTLTREELTAALAARQLLLERAQLTPAEAIRRLTPLQAQFAPAPYIALAARLEGFHRDALEAAFAAGDVVKTTIMRTTLHAVAADEYAAYAQLSRQPRLRNLRKVHSDLDLERLETELRVWLREPRSNTELRERLWQLDGMTQARLELMADDCWVALPVFHSPPKRARVADEGHARGRTASG